MKASTHTSMNVAIVDDDPFMLDSLQAMFQALDVVQVKTYAHVVDALTTLDAWPSSWDLLVLDIYMPEMDGVEFLRELSFRRFDGCVLFHSSATEEFLMAASKLAQRYGLKTLTPISKPPSSEQLSAALEMARLHRVGSGR